MYEDIDVVVCVVCLMLFILNMYHGVVENRRIVLDWYNEVESILREEFSHVGYYEGTDNIDKNLIWKDFMQQSNSCFKLYCTGRRNCKGLLATLKLRNRNNLFSWFYSFLFSGQWRDTLILEYSLENLEMVFAIFPLISLNTWRRLLTDVRIYAKHRVSSPKLPKDLVCYTHSPQLLNRLILPRIQRVLNDFTDIFRMLHFTDKNTYHHQLEPKVLRFEISIPDDMSRVQTWLRMSLHFVDEVARIYPLRQNF